MLILEINNLQFLSKTLLYPLFKKRDFQAFLVFEKAWKFLIDCDLFCLKKAFILANLSVNQTATWQLCHMHTEHYSNVSGNLKSNIYYLNKILANHFSLTSRTNNYLLIIICNKKLETDFVSSKHDHYLQYRSLLVIASTSCKTLMAT